MNNSTVGCDTTYFSNGSKIYWQYNCDRIWLTLENSRNNKVVIDEVPSEYYQYTYRLGFSLVKEYKNCLLFRGGCPANGPCIYTLVDKDNGKKIKSFSQLICMDTKDDKGAPQKYNYDFVVDLSENLDNIFVYFIDDKRIKKSPFKDRLTSVIPQSQFEKMTLTNDILTIYYEIDNCNDTKSITINLK